MMTTESQPPPPYPHVNLWPLGLAVAFASACSAGVAVVFIHFAAVAITAVTVRGAFLGLAWVLGLIVGVPVACVLAVLACVGLVMLAVKVADRFV